jgi:hypothetical protein
MIVPFGIDRDARPAHEVAAATGVAKSATVVSKVAAKPPPVANLVRREKAPECSRENLQWFIIISLLPLVSSPLCGIYEVFDRMDGRF